MVNTQRLASSPLTWLAVPAMVIVAVAIAARMVDSGEPQAAPAGELQPFYLEASIQMDDASASIGTQPAGSSKPFATVHRSSQVRWRWQSRDLARIDIETFEPAADAGTDTLAWDGTSQWYYRHEDNTYTRSPLMPVPAGVSLRVRPWSFGVFIGPWYGAATTAGAFATELKTLSNNTTDVRVAGQDTILGRAVTIVEQTGIATSAGSSGNTTRSGTSRFWLDEERMVVMKQETDSGAQRFTVEVTRLDWNIPATGNLRYSPPAGAKPADKGGSAGSLPTP